MSDVREAVASVKDEIGTVLVGNEELVERLAIALLTRGHVLLEGVPGVAKTTAARAFANATGLDSRRIQMTPDVLPADITGTRVYRENTGEFEFQRGPIFANVVIADEINRATPKTQSALLEAMQEGRVTVDGNTRALEEPFMVIATQNPIEMEGTFELPEAQRDRFQFKLIVDSLDRSDERAMIDRFDADATLDASDVTQVLEAEEISSLRDSVEAIYAADAVKEYIVDVIRTIREGDSVEVGASPRSTLVLLRASKGYAAVQGRDYVIPDDVKAMAHPVLRHRVILSTEADLGQVTEEAIIDDALATVEPPTSDATGAEARPSDQGSAVRSQPNGGIADGDDMPESGPAVDENPASSEE